MFFFNNLKYLKKSLISSSDPKGKVNQSEHIYRMIWRWYEATVYLWILLQFESIYHLNLFSCYRATNGLISMKLCMLVKSHLTHVFTQFCKVLTIGHIWAYMPFGHIWIHLFINDLIIANQSAQLWCRTTLIHSWQWNTSKRDNRLTETHTHVQMFFDNYLSRESIE